MMKASITELLERLKAVRFTGKIVISFNHGGIVGVQELRMIDISQ